MKIVKLILNILCWAGVIFNFLGMAYVNEKVDKLDAEVSKHITNGIN